MWNADKAEKQYKFGILKRAVISSLLVRHIKANQMRNQLM